MEKSLLSDQNSLIKRASYLRIVARDLADGMKAGNFRSLTRGQGIEFAGVRNYIRGDDIRSIDWNVTARMGNPYVKIFEEERELQIFIVVDSSKSMFLDTGVKKTKYSAAAEAAALITIAAEMNGCPVGAVFFDGAIHFSCKPQFGREQTMLILTHLDRLSEKPVTGSVLGNALTGVGKLLRKRSLIFVLSDFRTGDWAKPLINLAQKNDVVALRMQDKFDSELPNYGTVPFEDCESGYKLTIPTTTTRFKKEWRSYNLSNTRKWQDECTKHGILPVVFDIAQDPLLVLSAIFEAKK